jgi:hypothetical protein
MWLIKHRTMVFWGLDTVVKRQSRRACSLVSIVTELPRILAVVEMFERFPIGQKP